jgi:hypothetical protein
MATKSSKVVCGQVALVRIIIILIVLAYVGTELFLSIRGTPTKESTLALT